MASEPGKCCWVHNGLKQETPVTSVSEARESRRGRAGRPWLRVPPADGRAAASSGGWRPCEAVAWLPAFLGRLPLRRRREASLSALLAMGPSMGLLSTQHPAFASASKSGTNTQKPCLLVISLRSGLPPRLPGGFPRSQSWGAAHRQAEGVTEGATGKWDHGAILDDATTASLRSGGGQ